jgi:hypothetical protein
MERIARVFSRPVAKPYRQGDIRHDGPPYLNDDGHVDFAPDDVENPKNWSRWRRGYVTFCAVLLVLNATFASSSPSGCFEVGLVVLCLLKSLPPGGLLYLCIQADAEHRAYQHGLASRPRLLD